MTVETRPRVGTWPAASVLTAALAGGAVWGVTIRAWMRIIAEDPDFSWGGTLYIMIAPTLGAFLVGLAILAARRGPGLRRAVSIIGARASVVPLGMGAGAILVPTVIFGGLALAGRRLGVFGRVVVSLALVGGGFLGGSGLELVTIVVLAAMVALVLSGRAPILTLWLLALLPVIGVVALVVGSDISMLSKIVGVVSYPVLAGVAIATYRRSLVPLGPSRQAV